MSKQDMKESRKTHVTALEQPKGQNLFLSLTTTKKTPPDFCGIVRESKVHQSAYK